MAGMCSAHKGYVAGCPQCQSDPPCNGKCNLALRLYDSQCPKHRKTFFIEDRAQHGKHRHEEGPNGRCLICGELLLHGQGGGPTDDERKMGYPTTSNPTVPIITESPLRTNEGRWRLEINTLTANTKDVTLWDGDTVLFTSRMTHSAARAVKVVWIGFQRSFALEAERDEARDERDGFAADLDAAEDKIKRLEARALLEEK
jgi:hypothetical protein